MIGSFAKIIKTKDYPWGVPHDQFRKNFKQIENNWGNAFELESLAPTLTEDPVFRRWWARFLRLSASPATAIAFRKMNSEIDIRKILPTIRVPTLVIHAKYDSVTNVREGQYLSENLPVPSLKLYHQRITFLGSGARI
jgi:pimeloyl-ACP methyl ester carboxylesterase